jgi:MtN3 and saliva related transmembrane protein
MQLITIVGILASALTATSLIPQLTKLIKEKQSQDLSVVMLLVLLGGLALWIYYGALKEDLIIIISNSFAFLINVCTLYLALHYKN